MRYLRYEQREVERKSERQRVCVCVCVCVCVTYAAFSVSFAQYFKASISHVQVSILIFSRHFTVMITDHYIIVKYQLNIKIVCDPKYLPCLGPLTSSNRAPIAPGSPGHMIPTCSAVGDTVHKTYRSVPTPEDCQGEKEVIFKALEIKECNSNKR